MKPSEHGRLCAKCDRQLIDFTRMSEDEIRAFHLRNPGTCGLYSLSQFHLPGSQLAAAAAAAAIGLAAPAVVHAEPKPPMSEMVQSQVAPADSVLVMGTVVDSATNQPIAGAQVMAIGTRFGAITDSSGQFRFFVRVPIRLPMRLRALMIGYSAQEAAVVTADSVTTVKFVLSPAFVGIRELVVVGPAVPAVPRDKPSFWRRLWRFLGGR